MARPGRPERNRAARSFRQLRRFHHVINSDDVFGAHNRRPCDVGPDESRATSQGRQALAASCRDCSAAWLPQEHTHVSWCMDCTEAFRQGRQAPAVSCMDCIAVWLLWERIRIAWCTDYIAAAPPPPNLGGIEKTQ